MYQDKSSVFVLEFIRCMYRILNNFQKWNEIINTSSLKLCNSIHIKTVMPIKVVNLARIYYNCALLRQRCRRRAGHRRPSDIRINVNAYY